MSILQRYSLSNSSFEYYRNFIPYFTGNHFKFFQFSNIIFHYIPLLDIIESPFIILLVSSQSFASFAARIFMINISANRSRMHDCPQPSAMQMQRDQCQGCASSGSRICKCCNKSRMLASIIPSRRRVCVEGASNKGSLMSCEFPAFETMPGTGRRSPRTRTISKTTETLDR